MVKVIGVRFRTAGKAYFFDPLQFEIKKGDHVIVETARGIEFGTVAAGIMEVEEEKVVQPLKPVIRIANQRDMEQEAENREKEREAFKICLEKIRSHGMEMKLIDAEYTFDNNKVLFYFTADGRIDFRELVKDLASVFKTRIELRQIGVRDETKMMGGIGICGRPLCCHSYLSDFIPVSIRMAKEQNLSLNPTKISGVCGRLMCCLKNEEETYEELNKKLPNVGDSVTVQDGTRGVVHSVNVLRQLVKVVIEAGDEKEIKEYPVEKLRFRRKHSKKERMELSKEELQELERLEEEAQRQELEESSGMPDGEQRQGGRGRQNAKGRQGGRQSGQDEPQRMQALEEQAQTGPRQGGKRRHDSRNQDNREQDGRSQAHRKQAHRNQDYQEQDDRELDNKGHESRKRQGRRPENSGAPGGRKRYDNRGRRGAKWDQEEQ